MPAAESNTTMPARDFLNSYVEDLFIKDIQDNYDELVEKKKDTNAHLLVEKYWIVLKKVLDDADTIGYGENERLKDFAIEISLKMIDAFVEVIQFNKIPEADLEEYCEHQIDMVIDIVKRYNIGQDYMDQVAAIIVRYNENYVKELDNLPFEEFYKYTKKKGIEKRNTYYEKSMHELGVKLYHDLITEFIERFESDKDPQIRLYTEEFAYLLDKANYFDFIHEPGVPEKIVSAACVFLEHGMELKYLEKEVMRESIKQWIEILKKYEVINELFWNVLTDILSRYMAILAKDDMRLHLKFYWLFSQEIEILDRVATSIEEVKSGNVPVSKAPARKSPKSTNKITKKPKSAGGLKEL
jgi:hypothetical protein